MAAPCGQDQAQAQGPRTSAVVVRRALLRSMMPHATVDLVVENLIKQGVIDPPEVFTLPSAAAVEFRCDRSAPFGPVDTVVRMAYSGDIDRRLFDPHFMNKRKFKVTLEVVEEET